MCEFLDHWQVLIAGVLSVIAALAVVGVTLLSEHRKRKHELKILRRSLGIEVRQYLANAHRAKKELREMMKAAATNAIAVEDRTKFPPPSIYPHAAARIAEFGSTADTIVSFFNKITAVGEGATRLTRHPDALSTKLTVTLRKRHANAFPRRTRPWPAFSVKGTVPLGRAGGSKAFLGS
jgi:hypothetical protein